MQWFVTVMMRTERRKDVREKRKQKDEEERRKGKAQVPKGWSRFRMSPLAVAAHPKD